MLSTLWSWLMSFCFYIPWVLMAAAAGMAWSKNRKSVPIMLELLGATAYFLFCTFEWCITKLFTMGHASWDVMHPIYIVFTFLEVVAMLLFAAGFCWEKFSQWRAAPSPASAVPVQ